MNYTPDEFQNLLTAVVAEGGVLREGTCDGTIIHYKKPIELDVRTCTCGNETLLLTPYAADEAEGEGLAEVCAVCDDVGKWPIFAGALDEDDE